MRDIAKAVKEYIDQNLELKNITYIPSGEGSTAKMTTAKERITKTSQVIAEEIVDIVLNKLNSRE